MDNRFKNKTKEQLEAIILGIESYIEGAANAWNMMNDFYKEIQDMGKDNINQCKNEMRRK